MELHIEISIAACQDALEPMPISAVGRHIAGKPWAREVSQSARSPSILQRYVARTLVIAFGTGKGATGTYAVNIPQVAGPTTLTNRAIEPNTGVGTGSISGSTMTITAMTHGAITVGQSVTGSGVSSGTLVTAFGTGKGLTGTYAVNIPQVAGPTTLTNSGPGGLMSVSAVSSGILSPGQTITGTGVTSGTVLTALLSGTGAYTVGASQTVGPVAMNGAGPGGILSISAVTAGPLGLGQSVAGSGVAAGTIIAAFGSGTGGVGDYTVSVSQTVASTTLASSPTASNQLGWTASQTGALQRILTYRPGGDLFEDNHLGGTLYEYDYNVLKRIVEVKQGGTQEGAYAYDFQGRRVWRETYGTGAAQTAYIFDPQGHLLAEHNASTGAVNEEYAWLDDMPVFFNPGNATVQDISTGQIDEPLVVTNSTGGVLWNAYVDPYGSLGTFATPSVTLNLRLPGQYYQAETDSLSQNGWRDYDPSLGRYVEGDPLGIDAGQNLYAYVDGDPLNLADFEGTSPLTDYEKDFLSPFIPMADLNAADLRIVNSLPHWVPGLAGATGVTIGHTIYIERQTFCGPTGLAVLGHELVHVGQYRVLGVNGFLLLYFGLNIGTGYNNNPLEVEAYRVQNEIQRQLNGTR